MISSIKKCYATDFTRFTGYFIMICLLLLCANETDKFLSILNIVD